jgi:hypothetical protein
MDQFLPIAFYGTIAVAFVVFVQAVVHISRSFAEISRSLEDIALSLRRKGPL